MAVHGTHTRRMTNGYKILVEISERKMELVLRYEAQLGE